MGQETKYSAPAWSTFQDRLRVCDERISKLYLSFYKCFLSVRVQKVWAPDELHQHLPKLGVKNKFLVPTPGLWGWGTANLCFNKSTPGNQKQADSIGGKWDEDRLHLCEGDCGRGKSSIDRRHVSGCLKDGRSLEGPAATMYLVVHPLQTFFRHSTLEENLLRPRNCSHNGSFFPLDF